MFFFGFLIFFCFLFFFDFFFFNDTATTEIYTLSLHDALPISWWRAGCRRAPWGRRCRACWPGAPSGASPGWTRSEEHTSELQSRENLVCRLLLEKKKKKKKKRHKKTKKKKKQRNK